MSIRRGMASKIQHWTVISWCLWNMAPSLKVSSDFPAYILCGTIAYRVAYVWTSYFLDIQTSRVKIGEFWLGCLTLVLFEWMKLMEERILFESVSWLRLLRWIWGFFSSLFCKTFICRSTSSFRRLYPQLAGTGNPWLCASLAGHCEL